MSVRLFAETAVNQSINRMCSGAAKTSALGRPTEQQCWTVADRETENENCQSLLACFNRKYCHIDKQ